MSRQFEKDILDVLGMGDRRIKELTIRCAAGQITEVSIVEFLIDEPRSVETIARTFDLVERKEETQTEAEVGKSINPPLAST